VDEQACGDIDGDAEEDVGEEAEGGGEDGEVLDFLEAGRVSVRKGFRGREGREEHTRDSGRARCIAAMPTRESP
jgi:hypothetical protein